MGWNRQHQRKANQQQTGEFLQRQTKSQKMIAPATRAGAGGGEFPESVTNQEGKSMYVKETAQTETTVRGMRDTVLFTALPCPASG